MQKLMKAMHKNEKGFTLVELMVVVVIIGILVAIAIPIYSAITARAERSTITANVRIIDGAIQMAIADDEFDATTTIADLEGAYIEDVEVVGEEEYGIWRPAVGVLAEPRAMVEISAEREGNLDAGIYRLTELLVDPPVPM